MVCESKGKPTMAPSISRRAFLVASGKTRVGLWLFLKSLLVVLACVCVRPCL